MNALSANVIFFVRISKRLKNRIVLLIEQDICHAFIFSEANISINGNQPASIHSWNQGHDVFPTQYNPFNSEIPYER